MKQFEKATMMMCFLIVFSLVCFAQTPSAPNSLTITGNESPTPTAGSMLNTSGGTISNITISATTQNPHWKGFVGNVSGQYVLSDSDLSALKSWDIESLTGELYATRTDQTIDWDSIVCANDALVASEEDALNITRHIVDSINRTFNETSHGSFYVGTTQISANSCKSMNLNVNGTEQSDEFFELLLSDGTYLLYASLLENNTDGYNNNSADFQMIVAESGLEGTQPNTAYYFYIELI